MERFFINVQDSLTDYFKQTKYFGKKKSRIQEILSALRIFTKGGVPVWTNASQPKEAEQDIMDGGFFSAISAFANMKMGKTEIQFQGGNKSFIIFQSASFIATIQWEKNSKLPVEESKATLNNLLQYLDNYQQFNQYVAGLSGISSMA